MHAYHGYVLIPNISGSDCRVLVCLSSSFPLFLGLCSDFHHFSSLPFPCVLLLQCSVSLLLGWPLRKPWARWAALLTLTLGLPVAQRASGKFSSLRALASGAESMYVFMEFWQIPSSLLSLLRCRLDMQALYLIPHSLCRQRQCGGGAMGPWIWSYGLCGGWCTIMEAEGQASDGLR